MESLSSNMINSFGTKKYSEKLVRNTMYTSSYMSRVYIYGVDLNDDELQTLQISKNFRGGMPPDPPNYARPRNMIQSHFKLDPPLL